MDCNVIMDLLPLYADDCCSVESRKLVESHIANCKTCKKALADMNENDFGESVVLKEPVKVSRINQFKASVVQSVMLFLSFAAIVLGVTFEAATPMGAENGKWAYMIIVPATAFMLSLANWYFVRLYKSKKAFCVVSAVMTATFAAAGYGWAIPHFANFATAYVAFGVGCVVALVLCVLSIILSSVYAKALGKE